MVMKSGLLLTVLVTFFMMAAGFHLTGREKADDGPVRHVVVFKYAEGATAEQIQVVTDAFRNLKNTIPGILSFEHGTNMSPEGLDQGFNHIYVLTFENAAARDAYLPHPEHRKFGQILRESGIFEGAFVVDFVPEE